MTVTAEDIAQGYRLAIVLRPNHDTLETNEPVYDETYPLPMVFCEATWFTGVTRPAHGAITQNGLTVQGFGYGNALPVYSIYFPNSMTGGRISAGHIATKLMSLNQYDTKRFLTLPKGELVYSVGDNPTPFDTQRVRDGIQAGQKFYGVVTFQDERVWSLPIDIAYDFFETDRLEFRTECFPLPGHLTEPKRFREGILTAQPNAEDLLSNPRFSLEKTFPVQWTYLRLRDDGTFLTASTDGAGTEPETYARLRVYAYP